MTKQELEKEVKLLRNQMASLKDAMLKREEKLFKVIELLEPFMPVLLKTEEEQAAFLKQLKENDI